MTNPSAALYDRVALRADDAAFQTILDWMDRPATPEESNCMQRLAAAGWPWVKAG